MFSACDKASKRCADCKKTKEGGSFNAGTYHSRDADYKDCENNVDYDDYGEDIINY